MPRLSARCHTAHSQHSAVDQAEMAAGRVKARQPRVPEYSVTTMSVNKYGPVIRGISQSASTQPARGIYNSAGYLRKQ
eukprot:COSAG02_NODE_7316_length_3066_cov_17.625276_1_plen_78_part_00